MKYGWSGTLSANAGAISAAACGTIEIEGNEKEAKSAVIRFLSERYPKITTFTIEILKRKPQPTSVEMPIIVADNAFHEFNKDNSLTLEQ